MEARQQSWPRIWLMTDERLGEGLWNAIARLPANAGIVFRHYSLAPTERARLARDITDMLRDRGITLAIAADVELAKAVGSEFVHNPSSATDLPFSRSVHNVEQAEAARSAGAALVFVSPVYATRSHPRREPLGVEHAAKIAQAAGVPAIALGGVDAENFPSLEQDGFYGWAGIDAWM
jgi:thiamine-phosphate pyrophosphorylase